MLSSTLNLDTGETIILEVRKHWIVFIWNAIASILYAIFPIILFSLILYFSPKTMLVFVEKSGLILIFFYLLWLLLVWTAFFIQWTNYYLDVWFVTQKRIIHIDQKGIFHREVSNLRFDKIQDISIEVSGVLATFLNYGDLRVQTAAEDSSEFFMRNAARPEQVRKVIFSRHNVEAEKMYK